MPDLGKYAAEVLLAYGVTLTLLAGIVAISIARYRRMRQTLEDAEGGKNG